MKWHLGLIACAGITIGSVSPVLGQTDPNPAMNAPDQVAWQLFIQVNTRAGGTNSLFETWASDSDTFQPNPQFPSTPTLSALRRPLLPAVAREALQKSGGLLPAVPPNVNVTTEKRAAISPRSSSSGTTIFTRSAA